MLSTPTSTFVKVNVLGSFSSSMTSADDTTGVKDPFQAVEVLIFPSSVTLK